MRVGAQTFLKINKGVEIKEKALCLFLFQRRYPEFFNFLFSILQSPFHLSMYAKTCIKRMDATQPTFKVKRGEYMDVKTPHFLEWRLCFPIQSHESMP
jgi:hypothetical protein